MNLVLLKVKTRAFCLCPTSTKIFKGDSLLAWQVRRCAFRGNDFYGKQSSYPRSRLRHRRCLQQPLHAHTALSIDCARDINTRRVAIVISKYKNITLTKTCRNVIVPPMNTRCTLKVIVLVHIYIYYIHFLL
jgi:hypothetical protein